MDFFVKDALAHYRIAQGEKTVSIDLGVMVSEGVFSENESLQHRLMDSGFYFPLRHTELFALLDYYCDPALDILTTQTCQTVVGIETPASLHPKGIDEAPWMRKPLFGHMYQVRGDTILASGAPNDSIDFRVLFASAGSVPEAGSVALQVLINKLSQTLSTSSEGIDPDKPVHSYGVDSLLRSSCVTWITKEFAAEMAVFEILGGATATAIAMTVARNSRLMQGVR